MKNHSAIAQYRSRKRFLRETPRSRTSGSSTPRFVERAPSQRTASGWQNSLPRTRKQQDVSSSPSRTTKILKKTQDTLREDAYRKYAHLRTIESCRRSSKVASVDFPSRHANTPTVRVLFILRAVKTIASSLLSFLHPDTHVKHRRSGLFPRNRHPGRSQKIHQTLQA